jgi:hypothetical protein
MTPFEQQIEHNRKVNETTISALVQWGANFGARAAAAAQLAEQLRARLEPPDFKILIVPTEELLTAFEHFRDEIVAACTRLRGAIG